MDVRGKFFDFISLGKGKDRRAWWRFLGGIMVLFCLMFLDLSGKDL